MRFPWYGVRAAALVPLLLVAFATHAADKDVTFMVEGSRIVARDATGATLSRQDLIGLTFEVGNDPSDVYVLRIDDVTQDPATPALDLYEVSVRKPHRTDYEPLCEPDPAGRITAVAVPGSWTKNGRFVRGAPGQVTFACTAGARGKCIRFGYTPWTLASNGESLAPYHTACVRMMRADYCGDGTPYTVPGVTIQIVDRVGIHPPTEQAYGAFEAVWGEDGALCLARARRPEFPLKDVLRACPRLAALPPGMCNEDFLGTPGALLANRS